MARCDIDSITAKYADRSGKIRALTLYFQSPSINMPQMWHIYLTMCSYITMQVNLVIRELISRVKGMDHLVELLIS